MPQQPQTESPSAIGLPQYPQNLEGVSFMAILRFFTFFAVVTDSA
jgi:hypothetical protein